MKRGLLCIALMIFSMPLYVFSAEALQGVPRRPLSNSPVLSAHYGGRGVTQNIDFADCWGARSFGALIQQCTRRERNSDNATLDSFKRIKLDNMLYHNFPDYSPRTNMLMGVAGGIIASLSFAKTLYNAPKDKNSLRRLAVQFGGSIAAIYATRYCLNRFAPVAMSHGSWALPIVPVIPGGVGALMQRLAGVLPVNVATATAALPIVALGGISEALNHVVPGGMTPFLMGSYFAMESMQNESRLQSGNVVNNLHQQKKTEMYCGGRQILLQDLRISYGQQPNSLSMYQTLEMHSDLSDNIAHLITSFPKQHEQRLQEGMSLCDMIEIINNPDNASLPGIGDGAQQYAISIQTPSSLRVPWSSERLTGHVERRNTMVDVYADIRQSIEQQPQLAWAMHAIAYRLCIGYKQIEKDFADYRQRVDQYRLIDGHVVNLLIRKYNIAEDLAIALIEEITKQRAAIEKHELTEDDVTKMMQEVLGDGSIAQGASMQQESKEKSAFEEAMQPQYPIISWEPLDFHNSDLKLEAQVRNSVRAALDALNVSALTTRQAASIVRQIWVNIDKNITAHVARDQGSQLHRLMKLSLQLVAARYSLHENSILLQLRNHFAFHKGEENVFRALGPKGCFADILSTDMSSNSASSSSSSIVSTSSSSNNSSSSSSGSSCSSSSSIISASSSSSSSSSASSSSSSSDEISVIELGWNRQEKSITQWSDTQ